MAYRFAERSTIALLGVILLLHALAPSIAAQVRLTDDLGRDISLPDAPTRIVSLVPAITEVLYALGAGGSVAGRSTWDDQPPEVRSVPSVGDALRPDAESVIARNPDLVILYAGSDNARSVDQFERLDIAVLAIRIDDLDDLQRNVLRLGDLLGRKSTAESLWASIEFDLAEVARATRDLPRTRVYYDVAWPPAITVGAGSYLDTLVSIAGGENVFGDLAAPSPQVSLEAIVVRSPQLILVPIMPDGMPADLSTRPGWAVIPSVRDGRIRSVDAGLLHRLGPRIGKAARALAEVLHPELQW
ncbi:MAG: helical backbone metal receptor [marine benthic group bacterium]|nr:helical backbone metal receptor [Gemmatimonadota bacterium]